MSISEPFIHRPVATTLLTIALGLAGGIAYFYLPVAPLPEVEFPTLMVSGCIARRESGDDGIVGRNAFGTPVRTHRRPE